MDVVEFMTPNHFKYDGKVYFTKKETLAGYKRRKTLRNLLSRSRLLSDAEASSVPASYGRVIVMLCDGFPYVEVTQNVRDSVTRREATHEKVKIIYRSELTNVRVARELIKKHPPRDFPELFGIAYITPNELVLGMGDTL